MMQRRLLVAILSAACQNGDGRTTDFAVRDSASIPIAESFRPRWSEERRWTVAETPRLEIGQQDGGSAYQLYRVRGARVLDDNRIVVANAGTGELRFYGPDGRHLGSVGGEGGGPGEFDFLAGIDEDSSGYVVAWDGRLRRLSLFTPSGQFRSSVTVESLAGTATSAALVGLLPDGSFVLREQTELRNLRGSATGERRDTVTYSRFAPDGYLQDTLLRSPGREEHLLNEEKVWTSVPVLFGRDTHMAIGGNRIYVGESDRYSIRVINPEGVIVKIIRNRQHRNREVYKDDVARARRTAIEELPTLPPHARAAVGVQEKAVRQAPNRKTLPSYSELRVDQEGNLWVREAALPDEQSRWTVFDSRGQMLGSVLTPSGLIITEIGTDFIIGIWRNDLEVEYVRIYDLAKPQAG
jgi:hypothetical protein